MTTPQPLLNKGISRPPELFRTKLSSYTDSLEGEYTNLSQELEGYRKEQHDKAQAVQSSILRMELKQIHLIQKIDAIKSVLADSTKTAEQKISSISFLFG